MSEPNPYAAPQTNVGTLPLQGQEVPNIELVESGQKLVIYSILLNLGSMVARGLPLFVLAAIALAALAMSLAGIFRLATGLGFSSTLRIVFAVCMLVPLVNLVVLFVLNSKATRALRNAGYKVGLLGASKKT